MFSEIRIQNFKSIHDLELKPGRVTVLIGENGGGKSNILEAIGFAAGASADKLDDVYLSNRGIRVTESRWMTSALATNPDAGDKPGASELGSITITVKSASDPRPITLTMQTGYQDENGIIDTWLVTGKDFRTRLSGQIGYEIAFWNDVKELMKNEDFARSVNEEAAQSIYSGNSFLNKEQFFNLHKQAIAMKKLNERDYFEFKSDSRVKALEGFLIYAPENTVLRTPPPETAMKPLGAKGEGLFNLLQTFSDAHLTDELRELKELLGLFGWFDDLLPPDNSEVTAARIQIKDKWLAREKQIFDQRNANEGFLFVLFYLTLLMSKRTPEFFAIDNIDTALNPRLCAELMKQIVELAKKHNKQVICTTHNPAILDGLNLHDDEQRLFTVLRDSDGRTIVKRVNAPKPQPGETPVRLSIAFMRGLIGGLPEHF